METDPLPPVDPPPPRRRPLLPPITEWRMGRVWQLVIIALLIYGVLLGTLGRDAVLAGIVAVWNSF